MDRITKQHLAKLGLSEKADFNAVKIAYRKKIAKYHPDKVSNLGKELRDLAEKEAKEINLAFDYLKKNSDLLESSEEEGLSGISNSSKKTSSSKTKAPSSKTKDPSSGGDQIGTVIGIIIVMTIIFTLISLDKSTNQNYSNSDYDNSSSEAATTESDVATTIYDDLRSNEELAIAEKRYTPLFGYDWKYYLKSEETKYWDSKRNAYVRYDTFGLKPSYRVDDKIISVELNDVIVKGSEGKNNQQIEVKKIEFFDRTTRVTFLAKIIWENGRKILNVKPGVVEDVTFPIRFPQYNTKQHIALKTFGDDCHKKFGSRFGWTFDLYYNEIRELEDLHRFSYADIQKIIKERSVFDGFSDEKTKQYDYRPWCGFEFTVEVPIDISKITFVGVDNPNKNITYNFINEIGKIMTYWSENELYMTKDEIAKKPSLLKYWKRN